MNKFLSAGPGVFILLAIFALTACGQAPDTYSVTTTKSEYQARFLSIQEEESKLLENSECGKTGGDLLDTIKYAIDKFNTLPLAQDEPSFQVGHPNGADGISVRVCADDQLAAYAYSKTVALHEGLLKTLRAAAEAFARFEHDELDTALDNLAIAAVNRENNLYGLYIVANFPGSPSEISRSEVLFRSAVAFVIYHELGHTIMGHADYAQALGDQSLELSADAFAAETLALTGIDREGIDVVFAILGRISPDELVGHPSSVYRAALLQVE